MSDARNTGSAVLSVRDLKVSVGDTEIVKGVSLDVRPGERHALMGPNGSGKSTLASALMGHPSYRVSGRIFLDGHPIQDLPPHERARAGLFLGFQYPVAVPGVQVATFLRAAVNARRGREVPIREFRKLLNEGFAALDVPKGFASRYLNDGFSGGEKKRLEILQMLMLQPRFAVLDETGVLLITHYQRILTYVEPTHVHVFVKGRLVRSGGSDLALYVEEHGYDGLSAAA